MADESTREITTRVQLLTSPGNVTLLAFAAGRAANVRYLLAAGPTAPNPPQRRPELGQTDGRSTVS